MKNTLLLALCLLASCEKQQNSGEFISTEIDIVIENNIGQNLLLEQTPNFIDIDSIKLFYQINGDKFEVYNSNMDYPRNICYINDPGYTERIRIFPNDVENEEFPITFINWGNGDIDTIKCHFERKNNGGYVSCDKIWFNEDVVYPDSAIPELGRAFKIIK
jgi:hypothetical protein